MNMKSLAIVSGLSLYATVASATPYQTDIAVSYIDFVDNSDYNFRVALYFDSVSTVGHPLAEAAFLDQSSGVYLDYNRLGSDFGSRDKVDLGFEYYVPDSIMYLGANVVHISALNDGFDSDGSDTDWGLTLGVAPIDGLLVTTSYGVAPLMHTPRVIEFIRYHTTIRDESNDYSFNLSAKYIAKLDGDTALNITTTYSDQDWGNMMSLGADLFFDSTFSVGVWLEDFGMPTLSNGYGIRTEKFFTPQFSAQASYADYAHYSVWSVGAAIRL